MRCTLGPSSVLARLPSFPSECTFLEKPLVLQESWFQVNADCCRNTDKGRDEAIEDGCVPVYLVPRYVP